jgi:phosphoribosylanthranilate isomerase
MAELEKRRIQPITVGVFVNASAAQVQTILDECGLDLAQLSGGEPPQTLLSLGQRAFKALRPMDANALQQGIRSYPARLEPPAWLIDACQPGKYGGTGQTANWHLAAGAALHAPILLAGGLKPDNVAAAVAQVQPWGVDTASGVESAPGRKDTRQMAAFIQAARQTNQEKMQW